MEQSLYKTISSAIYKKSTLEQVLLNLEHILGKLEGIRKVTKDKVLEVIASEATNPMLKEILLIQANDNLGAFSSKELKVLVNKIQDMTNTYKMVNVSIAIPLTEPDIKELADKIEKKLNKKVILNIKIDPGLIGGIVIKEDKYIFDASLRNHLKSYENEWIKSLKRTKKAMSKTN